MPERDSDFFQVLIGQIAENARINVIVGKTLRVLPEANCVEPVRNRLHCGQSTILVWPNRTLNRQTISRSLLDGTSCLRALGSPRLPIPRLLLPRSGLERSDFVRWPTASGSTLALASAARVRPDVVGTWLNRRE